MFKPLLQRYRDWQYQRIIARQQFSSKTVAEIFTETFRNRYWRSKESVSGMGSELGQTEILRAKLPILLREHGIRSLLDLPCGDFNWMQHVDLSGIQYTGGDIVEELATQNQQRFGNAQRKFLHLDLLTDALPEADCVLIRDCLVHFSLAHISQALDNLKRSRIRYLLTTSFPGVEINEDIQTGYWRPLNLQKAPFFFPEPLVVLNDAGSKGKGMFRDKGLCLWELRAGI
jgi:hypothetical protein